MTSQIPRPAAHGAGDELLEAAMCGPHALVIDGDAGLGKTTAWLDICDRARTKGFVVLSARPGPAEVTLAYAALADVLAHVDPHFLAQLPPVQREAVDRVMVHAEQSLPDNERLLGAALRALLALIAAVTPVLLAIDDVQWIDPSSRAAIAFALRRSTSPLGVALTARPDRNYAHAVSWLGLGHPNAVTRVSLQPMSLGEVHELITTRLGRSLSRPVTVRIAEVSGGNPFYALELARLVDESAAADVSLPASLAASVHERLYHLPTEVTDLLLLLAAAHAPTVDLLARTRARSVDSTAELLAVAEQADVVVINGNRPVFTHPLLAAGVYETADAPRRRAAHRLLAATASSPEELARHLALAATSADPATLHALDAAAQSARAQGAPRAAAELLDLAIEIGGDTPMRRILAAGHHFRTGDTRRARTVVEPVLDQLDTGVLRAMALNLLAMTKIYDESYLEAITHLQAAEADAAGSDAVLAYTRLQRSLALGMSGQTAECLRVSELAVASAADAADPGLRSKTISLWVTVKSLYGHGVDHDALQLALELEVDDAETPAPFRASAVEALVRAWRGELDEARDTMSFARRHAADRGAESDMMWLTSHSVFIDVWMGRWDDARLSAEDAAVRAEQMGAQNMRAIAYILGALVNSYSGSESATRESAHRAIVTASGCDSTFLIEWPLMSLGFLEVSLGHHAEAVAAMKPLLERFDPTAGTEIFTSAYLPDAIEALVSLERVDEAQPLIEALEANGARHDHPWMLAAGARGRAMLLGAQGFLDEAESAARTALTQHARVHMPFETARTTLVLGGILRRKRQKDVAAALLTDAVEGFSTLGADRWTDRARAELARVKVGWSRNGALTPTERQIAELAASGLSNKDIASAMFISIKTVEVNLTRTYRKLGIRSRSQLNARLTRR